jgi:hypothetical protein
MLGLDGRTEWGGVLSVFRLVCGAAGVASLVPEWPS